MLSESQLKKKLIGIRTDVSQNTNGKLHLKLGYISESNVQPFCKAWRELFKNTCIENSVILVHGTYARSVMHVD